MTGLKGSSNLKFDFSVAELIAMIRTQMEAAGLKAEGAPGPPVVSEPGGGVSLVDALAALGLKLEPRKAPVEQFIIDHVEKVPIENWFFDESRRTDSQYVYARAARSAIVANDMDA